jgi:acylphosphatase
VIATGRRLGLAGWVRNRRDGAVEALIVGNEAAVGETIEACRRGPSLARIEGIDVDPIDLDVMPEGFTHLPMIRFIGKNCQ